MWAAARLLGLLTGPAGKVILIGLVIFGWTMYQRLDATSDCEETQLREQLLESQRQVREAREIAAETRQRADRTQEEMQQLRRDYEDLQSDLEADPELRCPLDPATRERLRAIQ